MTVKNLYVFFTGKISSIRSEFKCPSQLCSQSLNWPEVGFELISRTGTHLPFPTNTIKAFIHLFMHLKRYVRIDLGTAQTVYVHFICNLMGVCVPWQWLGYCLLFIFLFLFLVFIISCCSAVTFSGFLFFLKAWKINSKRFHLVLFWKVWPEGVRVCFLVQSRGATCQWATRTEPSFIESVSMGPTGEWRRGVCRLTAAFSGEMSGCLRVPPPGSSLSSSCGLWGS